MKFKITILCAIGALALSACSPPSQPTRDIQPAVEQVSTTPGIAVSDAWAAATPGGATVGAGYMTIANNGPADTLVRVSSPRAPSVELHEMSMDGDIMRMRPVANFTVPADGVVSLTPSGFHLMFIDLSAPFVAGETVQVTLTFERAGVVEVDMPVRNRTASENNVSHEHH
ncbi:MAG: copper chaperone PCu(A)C [Hyphomonadaceae bacterium]|nr:copper chaperone PCu(A)C [Hyphomonadaceae bacterium]